MSLHSSSQTLDDLKSWNNTLRPFLYEETSSLKAAYIAIVSVVSPAMLADMERGLSLDRT